MRKIVLGVLIGVFASTVWQTVTFSQTGVPPQAPPTAASRFPPGTPPQIAFDIPKTDVDTLLKCANGGLTRSGSHKCGQ